MSKSALPPTRGINYPSVFNRKREVTSTMPTFLLVHGAWHSGRCWDRVVPLLESAGHSVIAPSLTGTGDRAHLLTPEVGLDTHVDDVVRLIDKGDLEDVVLVGHSYGGGVISAAANLVPESIAHLVYVDSTAPKDGETAIDALPRLQRLIDLAAKSANPWRIPPPSEQPPPVGLLGVVAPADIAWLRTLLSDHPARSFQQPKQLDNPAAKSIPRTHIRCIDVNAKVTILPPVPELQPNGSPSQVWSLPTGHECMITMPCELSDLLIRTASRIR
ncbi:alpha/beta hydrolase [Amycolatopsis sp. NBC_01488]|uniref:alpha/beta hydrolase n=1 Tax=Amycolatopsis sp. NBC_01488 TaxID=2903563 RepID=UPI002E2BC027|nr:alpha/beta fold hydrolase [Amycolatopsis sp. NBC_01488]